MAHCATSTHCPHHTIRVTELPPGACRADRRSGGGADDQSGSAGGEPVQRLWQRCQHALRARSHSPAFFPEPARARSRARGPSAVTLVRERGIYRTAGAKLSERLPRDKPSMRAERAPSSRPRRRARRRQSLLQARRAAPSQRTSVRAAAGSCACCTATRRRSRISARSGTRRSWPRGIAATM
jgi:hypothetical protein